MNQAAMKHEKEQHAKKHVQKKRIEPLYQALRARDFTDFSAADWEGVVIQVVAANAKVGKDFESFNLSSINASVAQLRNAARAMKLEKFTQFVNDTMLAAPPQSGQTDQVAAFILGGAALAGLFIFLCSEDAQWAVIDFYWSL
jgi:hypothetical protein